MAAQAFLQFMQVLWFERSPNKDSVRAVLDKNTVKLLHCYAQVLGTVRDKTKRRLKH